MKLFSSKFGERPRPGSDIPAGPVEGWLLRALLIVAAAALPGFAFGGEPTGLLQEVETAPHWIVGPLILLATLTSEDLACVTTGILSSRGIVPFWYACLWCWGGIFAGDIALYLLGRVCGERVAQNRLLGRFLTPKRLQKGRHMFEEHGVWVLFSARFLPGSRMPAFIAAGILNFPLPRFATFLAFAGLLWTPALIGMARWWGDRMTEWLDLYERYLGLAVFLTIGLTWITIRLLMPFFSERGRRLLLSSIYRVREWEFWPPAIIYGCLLPAAIRLACKFRHPLVFTAANPAIPHSGLALESKAGILAGLEAAPENRQWVARWRLISPGLPEARLRALQEFQETLAQPLPLVLKPDIGERGQGVAVIRSASQAAAYLRGCEVPVLAQEYVHGVEFGLFYYRLPGASRGEILSITRKDLLAVTGNGHSTLEELILHHPRALRMARFFLRKHEELLDWTPAQGETVPLGEVGNHCRGSLFTDARALKTEALGKVVDAISQRFPGFYFGRYDVRVPEVENLRRGTAIKILELNGVGAEVTHIYQPGYPFSLACHDLADQWRIAYEIGAANREAGAPMMRFGEFIRLVWECARRRPYEVVAPVPTAGMDGSEIAAAAGTLASGNSP